LVWLIAKRCGSLDVDSSVLHEIGKLVAVVLLVDFFLKFAELLTMFWSNAEAELAQLSLVTSGPFSLVFLIERTIGGFVPFAILGYLRARRSSVGLAVASVLLIVGVFAYRVELILPEFAAPLASLPPRRVLGTCIPGASSYAVRGAYSPTWVEYAVTGAMIAPRAFIVIIGAKIIPFGGTKSTGKEKQVEATCFLWKRT